MKSTSGQFTYALEWFKYHAAQRYESFKVYTTQLVAVSIGGIGTLAIKGTDGGYKDLWQLLLAISLYGFLTSLIFFLLDKRNEELVKLGEQALESCENLFPQGRQTRILWQKKNSPLHVQRGVLESHTVMIKLFYFLGMGFFLFGTCYSLHNTAMNILAAKMIDVLAAIGYMAAVIYQWKVIHRNVAAERK